MTWTLRSAAVVAIMIAAIWMGLANDASAQTIGSTDANMGQTGSTTFVGQSFQATVTGTVTRIRVRAIDGGPANLFLYNGSNTGAANGSGAPVSQQLVTLANRSVNLGYDELVLTQPLPVTAGTTYAFAFDVGNIATNQNGAGAYADGAPFHLGTTPLTNDLIFQVVQVAAAPVPTLSEWAMILFGVLLAGGAALFIQRRQQIA